MWQQFVGNCFFFFAKSLTELDSQDLYQLNQNILVRKIWISGLPWGFLSESPPFYPGVLLPGSQVHTLVWIFGLVGKVSPLEGSQTFSHYSSARISQQRAELKNYSHEVITAVSFSQLFQYAHRLKPISFKMVFFMWQAHIFMCTSFVFSDVKGICYKSP